MSDSMSLALLLEFVQNPLILKNFAIHKYHREEIGGLTEGNYEMGQWMDDLARTVEATLKHLDAKGIPAARIATAYLNGSDRLN